LSFDHPADATGRGAPRWRLRMLTCVPVPAVGVLDLNDHDDIAESTPPPAGQCDQDGDRGCLTVPRESPELLDNARPVWPFQGNLTSGTMRSPPPEVYWR
jgi:hypothetical protein